MKICNMIEKLQQLDENILLAINGAGGSFFDHIMLFFSNIPVWIPLYVIVAAAMFFPKQLNKNSFYRRSYLDCRQKTPVWLLAIISILAIALCFGICDQLSVYIKNTVARLRPDQDPALADSIRFIAEKSSLYGFLSGHATNTFGFAILTLMIFRAKPYSIFILSWASIVSFSRIYLAKHYLSDVIGGAILGMLIGFIVFILWKLIVGKLTNRYNLRTMYK